MDSSGISLPGPVHGSLATAERSGSLAAVSRTVRARRHLLAGLLAIWQVTAMLGRPKRLSRHPDTEEVTSSCAFVCASLCTDDDEMRRDRRDVLRGRQAQPAGSLQLSVHA
jgi:hypothetical protein